MRCCYPRRPREAADMVAQIRYAARHAAHAVPVSGGPIGRRAWALWN